MGKCIYKPSFQDQCDNDASLPGSYCDEHKFISCAYHYENPESNDPFFVRKCQNKASGECSKFRGEFICGMPLCEKHLVEHEASHISS